MTSAAQTVLNTTELLEAILLEVGEDMQTLLHAQRVNHTFLNTISGSIHLQRALWFQPMPPAQVSEMSDTRNPLLLKHHIDIGISEILQDCLGQHVYVKPEHVPVSLIKIFEGRMKHGSWRRMLPLQARGRWLLFDGKVRSGAGGDSWSVHWTDDISQPGKYHLCWSMLNTGEGSEPITMGEILGKLGRGL